ncbi:MAG TPA: choice-of-anchor D domain-containing protein [Terriglobia bacterium]|nr:choice-of-anchor D domain-containing protein [Terriglobia bacterium]
MTLHFRNYIRLFAIFSVLSISPALLAQTSTMPQFGHVVLVVGENADSSSTFSSSNMPYLTSLANSYGLAINYYADTHPSIGNYFVLTAGQIFTNDDSETPSSMPLSDDNIALEVQNAGKTWRDYQESVHGCGALNSGSYYARHDPLTYFTDINGESANFVCMSQFQTDIANKTLANLSWLVPNGCDDAHDCSLGTFDNWLKAEIAPLLASSYFQPGGDGLLIITFDENSGSGSTTTTGTTDGGKVETVVISAASISGHQSSTRYYHESALRTMAEALSVNFGGLGAAASAAPMADFFSTSGSGGAVSLTPTAATLSATVGSSSNQKFTVSNTTASSVNVTGVTIIPGNLGAEFTQSNNCSSLGANSGSCTVTVTFTPSQSGTATATLSVIDSASSKALVASLTGNGTATSGGGGTPAALLSSSSLSFPNITVGSASAAQSVTLSNTGNAALSISSVRANAPFAQTNNCGSSLAAGQNCTISVTFTPTTSGTATGTLSVSDNASGSPQTASLSGSGITSSSASGSGSGSNYYVSSSGSDSSGNGSSGSPWATIQHASTQVGPGATVHVGPGTYAGDFETDTSGTSSARLTYISDTPWAAKIVNSSYSGSLNQNVWDNEGSYVTIQGFDVSGKAFQGIGNGGSNVVIRGNHVHNVIPSSCNGNGGAGIDDHGNNSDDIGNVVNDVGNFSLGACTYVHGIYADRTGGHVLNNIIYHNWSNGIQVWGPSPSGITISGNTVLTSGNDGLVIGSDNSAADLMVVTDNIFIHNANYGFDEQGATGTRNQYNNNLTYANAFGGYRLQTGTQSATVESDPLLVNYQAAPVFIQPSDAGKYFQLQSSSPAINAGTSQGAPATDFDGNARPQTRSSGSGWDVGAFEYTGSTSSGSITVSPTSLTFGSQDLNTTSPAEMVTVKNGTSSTVSIGSVAISGSGSGDFADDSCGTSIAAGATCSISVTFTPITSGVLTATLSITPSSGGTKTVSLSGTGAASSINLSPNPLAFPDTTVNTTSAIQTATLSNNTNSTLAITQLFTITGPFAFGATGGTCPGVGQSLAAGGSCTITVVFAPTATGPQTGTVTIFDGAGSQTLTLAGNGTSSSGSGGTGGGTPAVSLSTTSLDFGWVLVGTTSGAQSITLSNIGTGSLSISGIGATAPFNESNNCGSSVAAGASCTILVMFSPTSGGGQAGTLTVSDNASGSPQTVSLSGRGSNSSQRRVSKSRP